nr:helix-turn-helix transcriptional regulator [Staphylococcus aureus]
MRKGKKYTQQEVADIIGINIWTVNRIENKKLEEVKLKTILRILDLYEITLYEFIEDNKDIVNRAYNK